MHGSFAACFRPRRCAERFDFNKYIRSQLPPHGALLLSVQAVERELGFWKTGSYVVPTGKRSSSQFSFDNWGDIKTRDSSNKVKLTRRATKFLATLKTWTPENRAELEAEAEEWLEVKKRFASSSRGSSDSAGEIEVLEDDEDEVIIVSD
ncbi:hypothetical protein C8F04DRAFT_1258748 [Mycena alexandri]|uniref:Uncharacterized protein n=1 Tax=Mycena alexandri TaxID=1745969 RepID=A0AAD6SY08_9AGAR|nr:hypothetical protein C8F04DRAFT_1258748 [Mycena alexandri]